MKTLNLKITNPDKQITGPVKVSSRFTAKEKRRLAKASKDFESMLTAMMLKSMTKSVGGLFGKSNYGGDVFDTIFESEIANYMTQNKSMGIAEQIYEKFTGEKLDDGLMNIKNPSTGNLKLLGTKIKSSGNLKKSKVLDRIERFESIINQAADKYEVDPNLIKSVILTESAGNPKAKSKNNAKGLMQLLDSTAEEMGIKNIWDPKENIFGGTKYLSKMIRKYNGNSKLALAAYNAGPAKVDKYNGIPPYKETQNYVKRVFNYLNNLEEL